MKYVLKEDRFEYPAGTVVYDFLGHDYGLARDDTLYTGSYHVSVTTDPDGEATPFFTVPVEQLARDE